VVAFPATPHKLERGTEVTERLLSLSEVAELTSTSKSFWRKLAHRRVVPTVRIGRLVRIPQSAVDAYMRLGLRPAVDRPQLLRQR